MLRGRGRARPMLWLAAVLVPLAATGVARALVANALEEQRERVARIESELPPLDAKLGEVRQLRPLVAEVLARMQIVEALADARIPAARVLGELSRLPPQIALGSVRADGRRLVLEGDAASAEALAAMVRQLAGSPLLDAPSVVAPRDDDARGARAFRVEARMLTAGEVERRR